jgi:hypothetical protein
MCYPGMDRLNFEKPQFPIWILERPTYYYYYYYYFTLDFSSLLRFFRFLDHIQFTHMVGLLWTSDQPVAEASTYTGQHNI